MALDLNVRRLHVYGDSQLIIGQVKGEYKVLKPELVKYHQEVIKLVDSQISHLKRYQEHRMGKQTHYQRVAKEQGNYSVRFMSNVPLEGEGASNENILCSAIPSLKYIENIYALPNLDILLCHRNYVSKAI